MNNTENPVTALAEAYEASQSEIAELRESLADVRAMMSFEDQGWVKLAGAAAGDHLEGLDLDEVHDIAAKISPRVAAGSLPKRSVDLHSGFVWGRGCHIVGTEKPKRGRPSNDRSFFIDKNNQESVFGESAQEELQKARFISGNVLAAVNKKTRKVNRIPFSQITEIKVDPDFPENVIAYLREWDTQDGTSESVKKKWYYTHRFEGTRAKFFAEKGSPSKRVPVAADTSIVDLRANRQVGHVLGIPDGLAGLLWSEAYGRIITYGETVQESLAKILFRVTNETAKGVKSTGVKVSSFGGHGGTASMAAGQELTAVSTAGRGYDFASARPVAAMAAAAWNVSNMDLLNDSSAAGSSYGSANALVGGNRNAMLLMQKEWGNFYKEIFEAAGLERPSVVFEPFETPDKYREVQSITLGSVALSDEEYRMKILDALDIVGDSAEIPELLKLRSVDRNANNAATQPSPDQGKKSGTNSGGSGANDMRSDGIGESLRREMAMEDIVNRFESLVLRAEALNK